MSTVPAAVTRAERRFGKNEARLERDQSPSSTTRSRLLAQAYLPIVAKFVAERMDKPDRREREMVAELRSLQREKMEPAHVVALCLLQGAIECVATRRNFVDAAVHVGSLLRLEHLGAQLAKDDPELEERLRKRHRTLKRRQADARRFGTKENRDKLDALKAGTWGLDLLTQALPEVFCWTDVKGDDVYQKVWKRLDFVQGAFEAVDAIVAEIVQSRPVFKPQTERAPDPWVGLNEGGPADARALDSVLLVRTRHKDIHAAVETAITDGAMRPVLDALSTLQSVPWKINKQILEVMKGCVDKHIVVPGLYNSSSASKTFKGRAGWTRVSEDIKEADKLMEAERFWTPVNVDWRGRINTMTSFNYQGEERRSALFLFAEGEPINERGLYWLKVHTANTGNFNKISKKPFDARIAWVDENRELIEKIAAKPGDNLQWTEASDPFMFIAACFELSAAWSAQQLGSPFTTHLPVSFDGSCSGLQHLCGMTREPEGSKVNLTPNETPQDTYQTVADEVIKRLEQEPDNAEAKRWLTSGVTRDVVKRSVMTYFYGSKSYGMAEHLRDDYMASLMDKVKRGDLEEHPFGDGYEQGQAAQFLAGHIYEAIKTVGPLPAKAMRFLQKLAGLLANSGEPLRWTTPIGLPWINRYHLETKKRVKLWLHDHGVKIAYEPQIYLQTRTIHKSQSVNRAVPNFVHACDAAHLMMTVNAAASEGITNIVTVHDSFGCLATQAERFRRIIREQFVQMYTDHDVLTEIFDRAKEDLEGNPTALKKLLLVEERYKPVPGKLDIRGVLNRPGLIGGSNS
jgi:DNA-directed RNA polymerase, mitochondrial